MNDKPFEPPSDDLPCTEEVELITDYLEGALPPAEAERFERHLELCSACRQYVEQMRAIAGRLGGAREEQLSPELRRGLIESFREYRRS
jgi:anti-sigma factor RsiW